MLIYKVLVKEIHAMAHLVVKHPGEWQENETEKKKKSWEIIKAGIVWWKKTVSDDKNDIRPGIIDCLPLE